MPFTDPRYGVPGETRDNTGRVLTYSYLTPTYESTIEVQPDSFRTTVKIDLTGSCMVDVVDTFLHFDDEVVFILSADATERTATLSTGFLTPKTITVPAGGTKISTYRFNGTKLEDGVSSNSFRNLNTIVPIGASYISLGKTGTAPSSALTCAGFFNWANLKLNKRFHVLNYAGVSGNTTTQMLARFNSDVLAFNPSYVLINGGGNDVQSDVSVSTILNNLIEMSERARRNGMTVIMITVPLEAAWSSNTSRKNTAHDVNEGLKRYSRSKANVILIDWNVVLVDPATGLINTAYLQSDQRHLSLLGAAIAGHYVGSQLEQIVPYWDSLPNSSDDVRANNTSSTYTNLVLNPMMTGNTSGKANTWTINGTKVGGAAMVAGTDYTLSKVSAFDAANEKFRSFEWQQIKLNTGDGVVKQIDFRPPESSTVGWVAGDYLYLECEFEADYDWSGVTYFQVALKTMNASFGSTGSAYDMFRNFPDNTQGAHPGSTTPLYVPRKGVFRTYTLLIGSTVAYVYPEVNFYGVAGTIRVSRFAIRRATPITVNGVTTFYY